MTKVLANYILFNNWLKTPYKNIKWSLIKVGFKEATTLSLAAVVESILVMNRTIKTFVCITSWCLSTVTTVTSEKVWKCRFKKSNQHNRGISPWICNGPLSEVISLCLRLHCTIWETTLKNTPTINSSIHSIYKCYTQEISDTSWLFPATNWQKEK